MHVVRNKGSWGRGRKELMFKFQVLLDLRVLSYKWFPTCEEMIVSMSGMRGMQKLG